MRVDAGFDGLMSLVAIGCRWSCHRAMNRKIACGPGAACLLAAVVVFLLAAIGEAGEPPVPPAAELGKLLGTYAEYEGLSPLEKARTKRPSFDYPPLSKEGAAAWGKALWQAWVERLKAATQAKPPGKLAFPVAWQKAGNIFLGFVQADYRAKPDAKATVTMRYGAVTFGEKPEKGWPVFINLHGGGPNPRTNDEGWVVTMRQYSVKQGLYVCPRSPVDTVGSWNEVPSVAALERLLAELPARWDIDPNRVYLMGFSMGAIGAFHLGPSMPDRWAAVAGTSGFTYLGARGRAAPDNLRNLPIMIQIGTQDMDFQRYPLARAFAGALKALRSRDGDGYLLEYKEHAGQKHMVNDRDTPEWLGRFTRDTLPKRIVWHQPLLPLPLGKEDMPRVLDRNPGFAAHLRHRFYWLRNDSPSVFQRLVASREGNTFRIEQARHVERLTLLLDDRMADLDKPVSVMAGDRELAGIKVARTVNALVASLVEYGDPELMFCAELDVPAPDSVAEMDKRSLTTAADLLLRAEDRMALKRFADAATDVEAALKLEPQGVPANLRLLMELYSAQKDTAHIVDTCKRLAEAVPDDVGAQFEAAMILMTCEPADLRDDKTALRYAEKAADLTQRKNPQILRASALAYFRNGQKDKAIETVNAALALIPAGQLANLRADLETTLRTFSGADGK